MILSIQMGEALRENSSIDRNSRTDSACELCSLKKDTLALEELNLKLHKEITERKLAQIEIEERKRILKAFFDLSPVMMGITQIDGNQLRVIRINKAALAFFDMREVTVENQLARDLGTHPDLEKRWVDAGMKCIETNASQTFLYERVINGKIRYLSATLSPLENDQNHKKIFSYVIQDNTALVKSERALHLSEERFRLAQEFAHIGIGTWEVQSASGAINWCASMRTIFDITELRPAPKSLEDFYHFIIPEDLEKVRFDFEEAILNKRAHHIEFRILTGDGSIRWIEGKGHGIYSTTGECIRVLGTATDITARRKAEILLQERTAQLTTLSKMSALGEMAGGISHEINNPLAIIAIKTALIDKELKKSKPSLNSISKFSEEIGNTTKRAAKIIEGLKAFARDGSQDVIRPTSIRNIIKDTLSFCEERFKRHGILLVADSIPDVELFCRPVQISQVLLNLLNNSHDAVIKNVKDRRVTLSVLDNSKYIYLTVSDNGSGIPKAIESRLFEPFVSSKPPGTGTGLGLSISRGIIESHNGTIQYRRLDGLSFFEIKLPKMN